MIADRYATDRGGSVGGAEDLPLAAMLPSPSGILDVRCGNGVPITREFGECWFSRGWSRQFHRNEMVARGSEPIYPTPPLCAMSGSVRSGDSFDPDFPGMMVHL